MIALFKRIAGFSLVAVISAFLFVVTFELFRVVANGVNIEAHYQITAAFSGTFFAFLFIRLGEALNKWRERNALNRSALIEIQHELFNHLNVLIENRDVARNLKGLIGALV